LDETRELLKGNTRALVLAVLREAPLHGYAIAREIERRSENALKCGEGALYPALHALEQDGLVIGRWEVTGGGPARKVYALTDDGAGELKRQAQAWSRFVTAVDRVMDGAAPGDEPRRTGGQPDAQPA
jgi:PadR family transcriptional regulator, regulatory protein PadR